MDISSSPSAVTSRLSPVCNNLFMYFPTISFSRLTQSLILRCDNVVTCLVWGITDTLKLSSLTPATVRLIPSIVIEPFGTINCIISLPALIVYQTALSSLLIFVILPTPSICPLTICPPNLPLAGIALSRLTAIPARRFPSDDLLIVSCITSALNCLLPIDVTVRHTPLTAILSPILVPPRISDALIVII